MDADTLLQMERYIDQSMPQLHSVVVAYKGSIVFEKYYGDYDKDTVHHAACSIKTVISSLVGIAIEEGALESTAQKMEEFFPRVYFAANRSPYQRNHDRKFN